MIRHYYKNQNDEDQMMELLEEIRSSITSADISFYLMDSGTYKNAYLLHKNYTVLVYKVDDVIVGFILAEAMTNDTINLLLLYVSKKHRRKGIAMALKTKLEDLARLQGYERIMSQVCIANKESVALNKKAEWECELDKVYPDYYYWFTKSLKEKNEKNN